MHAPPTNTTTPNYAMPHPPTQPHPTTHVPHPPTLRYTPPINAMPHPPTQPHPTTQCPTHRHTTLKPHLTFGQLYNTTIHMLSSQSNRRVRNFPFPELLSWLLPSDSGVSVATALSSGKVSRNVVPSTPLPSS